jgi:hypothetical protein
MFFKQPLILVVINSILKVPIEHGNSSLFNELNWEFFCMSGPVLKAHECQKRPNLHTNELNTTFFVRRAPQRLQIAENL